MEHRKDFHRARIEGEFEEMTVQCLPGYCRRVDHASLNIRVSVSGFLLPIPLGGRGSPVGSMPPTLKFFRITPRIPLEISRVRSGMFEHPVGIDTGTKVPRRKVAAERCCTVECCVYIIDVFHVPARYISVEGDGILEHTVHGLDIPRGDLC